METATLGASDITGKFRNRNVTTPLGPIARWGIDIQRNTIRVSDKLETNLPNVYAAGDVVTYEGKIELIATGFSEAAMAVNHAAQALNPKARYNPGHSTNLAIFKDK